MNGAPTSRARVARLTCTVLGQDQGAIVCPRVMAVALDFGAADPLVVVRDALGACGFGDEEEARQAVELPATPHLCRENGGLPAAATESLSAAAVLRHALILGLCTSWLYDPRRPVLWTRTSLTRRLELFSGREFYA